MTNWPWLVFVVSVAVKAAIVFASNDYRQGLILAGPTVFLELFPVLMSNRTDKWSSTVRTLDTFGRQGSSLIPLGVLMMLAILCLGNFVAVAVSELLRSDESMPEQLLSFHMPSLPALGLGELLYFIIAAPIVFLVGRWMGRRLAPNAPTAQGAGNVVAAHFCGMAMPMFLILTLVMRESAQFDSSQLLVSALLLAMLLFVSLYGYQRGRRQVLGVYMAHLLDRVSETARNEILALAYSEAVAYQRSGGRQPKITTLFSG